MSIGGISKCTQRLSSTKASIIFDQSGELVSLDEDALEYDVFRDPVYVLNHGAIKDLDL
ncbi:hypothetical protein [Cohnella lupini]|uniref:hypothetical protein n=1 Tax=Cohnella lupini TaxID=1294267 RepID=UPI0015F283F7|nr:hypothetical protein [Cohnella lupini]